MAYLCCGRVVLRKGTETLKVVQSVPVVYSRCSSCDASRRHWEPVEKETHTGQKWDKNDYRLARFLGRPKQVNTSFAIKLIDEVPPAPRT
jgi:NADH dehydrogenase (ubiquinone) Fe-S protein 6